MTDKPESPDAVPFAEKWGTFYASGVGNAYPDENLLRIIRGRYVDIPRSGRALDVGFGVGGSLIMLAQSGYEAYGLEVSEESITKAGAAAAAAGVKLHLDLLKGTELQYPDAFFDVVVSWNAIYYHGSRTRVREALQEFARVLKPGGVAILSVIHPENCVVPRMSADLGDGAHRFDQPADYDNRHGTVIFYEPTAEGWLELLETVGPTVEGYVEATLFDSARRNAWRLFLARKPK